MHLFKINPKIRLTGHLKWIGIWTVFAILFSCQASVPNPAGLSLDTCDRLSDIRTMSLKSYLHFSLPTELTHSMSHALPRYVCQKIPCPEIEEVVRSGGKIIIMGLPPEVFKFCKAKLNLPEFSEKEITKQKAGKRENIYRPVFFTTKSPKKDLYISVMAGEDYIKQVSGLVAYQIESKTGKDSDKLISILSFPKLESSIPDWTDLHQFVETGDTVLIGNVAYFYDYVQEKGLYKLLSEKENYFYKSVRVKYNSRVLNFLIVKHTFWGGMSAKLANKILQKRIFELIYMSKVATLKSPAEIYNKIYSPSRFLLLRNGKIESINNLKNGIAEYFPKLNSGTHLSVSTVIEEDMKMTSLARSLNAHSLDLEVSNLAKEIIASKSNVRFSSIHIVTDYLRSKGEGDKKTVYDLSNSRDQEAALLKKKSWVQIYGLMLEYLGAKI